MENFLSAELVCRSCGSKKEKNVPCSCMSHELNRPNPSAPITVTRNSIGSVSGDITPPGLPTKTRLHSDAHSSQATTPSAAVLANKRMSISDQDIFADNYGYMWYEATREVNGRSFSFWFAAGNGGNHLYVVPEWNMVVAITSSAYGQGYGDFRSRNIFQYVLKCVN